jgi:hypothetical protein
MNKNPDPQEVHSERHVAELNAKPINQAVEKASKDRNFIIKAVEQLDGLEFPAYKHQIIIYLKKKSANSDTLALYESLSGTMLYRDQYHIKTALEQNNPEAKQENQITDQTRTNLNVEPVNPTHKRKDYTEVQATAPKNYICDMCGKSFQSRDDLVHHQEFEFKDKEEK